MGLPATPRIALIISGRDAPLDAQSVARLNYHLHLRKSASTWVNWIVWLSVDCYA
jgi:hypothetical protein